MLAEVEIKSNRAVQRDAFGHMCASLFLSNQSLVAVLTVYLDESYNQPTVKHPNDPLVYTVGCWVSTVGQWKRFNREWHAALKGAGVEWFHMSEYESRLNEYAEWPDIKRIGVLKRLHRIIKARTIYGATISVNCAEYDEVVGNSSLRSGLGKTYYGFDVRMMMKHLAEWADENNHPGPIHYVFAELKGQGAELDSVFREALDDPELKSWLRLSGMWSKGLMRDVTQLQSADIVAYEVNKRAVNYLSNDPQFIRRSLNNLAAGIYQDRIAPLYFGKPELVKLVNNLMRAKAERAGAK